MAEEIAADGIVIRNPLGKEVTYGEYTKILLNRKSGTQSIFSLGDAQDKTVEDMDFIEGDITLVPDEGTLFSAVTLKKPADLVAENIALGKSIAGVEGSFEGAKDPVLNLAQTQLPFAPDADWGKYMYTGEGITYIVPDASYTVTYGESTHSIKSVWVEGLGRAVLGNTAFWGGEDTGHPFMIAVNDSKDMWVVDMYSQPESVNMAVSLVTETQTGGSSTLELEETTLEFTDVGYAYGYITDETFPDIRAGASYTVTWDGTEYACTALEVDGDVIMGNFIPLTGVDTGEPFIYLPNMATGEGTVLYSVYDTAEATHTVSIRLNFVSSDPVYTMDTTTLTFADAGGIYQCIQSLPLTHVLNGAHYVVTVDGTAYPTMGRMDGESFVIGNVALMYGEEAENMGIEDTGEPFAIILQIGIEGIITTLAGESHDISVALNFEGGGGAEAPTYLTKQLSSLPDLTSTDIITLVTKEELDSIGFDISKKCYMTIVPAGRVYPAVGYKSLTALTLCNYTTIGSGSTQSALYFGVYQYSAGTKYNNSVKSTVSQAQILSNMFASANTDFPYYDSTSGEIKYNGASTYKLNGNSGTAKYLITVGYN